MALMDDNGLWIRKSSERRNVFFLLGVFAILYGLVSLVNHYFFRTYTLDLGFYTNALFDYRNFRWNDSGTISEVSSNMLGGHFEPVLFLFAPLTFLFGTYTLLIVQILFLLWGGYCIYLYFRNKGSLFATAAAVFFLGYFTWFAALAFDFHTNVIAAACLPFLLLSAQRRKVWAFSAVFVFMLLCKENISLWLFFVALGLAVEYCSHTRWRNIMLMFAGAALTYFFVVVYLFIPWFSESGAYSGFLYSVVGNSPQEAFVYIISHPWETAKLLFENHAENSLYDGYKVEFHRMVVYTGLPFLILRPTFIWMLVPLYFQKMLHNDPSMWGVGYHYGAEFAPVLTVGIFTVLAKIFSEDFQKYMAIMMAFVSLAVTFHTMDSTVMFTDKSRIRIYKATHYKRTYDVKAVKEILRSIPADVAVSAQAPFMPHLALRDNVYQFPIVKNAEYLVISSAENTYPLETGLFLQTVNNYVQSPEWELWKEDDDFKVLKKRP